MIEPQQSRDYVDLLIRSLLPAIAFVSAVLALRTYRFNGRTKAAEFLMSLHRDFFTDAKYALVRQLLDSDASGSGTMIANFIAEEGDELTSFLNFFEIVAYLSSKRVLERSDAEALLGYYLQIMSRNTSLRSYIARKDRNYEHLRSFLKERERAGQK